MDTSIARQKLEGERERLRALRAGQEEDSDLDESQAAAVGELSNYDQHPGDVGTETFERTKDLAVEDQIDRHLKEIDAALARIDNSTYGRCEICGRQIDDERLEALPAARYCIEHQREIDTRAAQDRQYGEVGESG